MPHGELAIIWDLAVAINVGSWRGIMVTDPVAALPTRRGTQRQSRGESVIGLVQVKDEPGGLLGVDCDVTSAGTMKSSV